METQNDYVQISQLLDENLLQQTTPDIKEKVLEYGRLSQLVEPLEEEEQKVDKILEAAIDDALLNFWIEQVDHILGHYYGLLTEDARESYRNQGLVLRERIDPSLCSPGTASSDDWTNKLKQDNHQSQSSTKTY